MKELSYEEVNVNKVVRNDSYFDGKFIEYLGYKLLSFLITICTLFIAKPWADKIIIEYKINHTVYNGKRLKFEGKGASLFVERFKWILLTLITLGIYSFWIPLRMENWIISNTHFEDEDLVMGESYFDGKVLEIIGVNLFTYLICLVSFGLLLPYSLCYKYKWLANHTIINKKKIVFSGKSLNLIGSYLLWYLLSIITFGIYGIWMPVKLYGWKVKNTHIKLKDEKVESTSKVPLVIGFVLLFIIILVCTLIPKINVNKDNNFFDNIKSSINKNSGKSSNKIDIDSGSKDVTCISKESYDKIKQNIKEKDSILECNIDGLVIMITSNNDDLTTSDVINYIKELLGNLSDSELNNINISISFEKVNTNSDFYLYGELVSGSGVIEWKKNDEKFDTTKINTSLNSDNTKSNNQIENVTTKKVVEKTTTVQNKCSNNGIYADGICYDKNSYVYPGSCGYLNEIDGKCYYPGCDETNYLTDENCVNDYVNKPSSNECPIGFKYIDGLCYGSVIN